MPYLILAEDRPGMDSERERVREAHRAHLAAAGEGLLASGAILAEDGVTVVGGASLLDTDDEAAARAFEADDPYAAAGIRAKVTVVRWRLRWWRGAFRADGFESH